MAKKRLVLVPDQLIKHAQLAVVGESPGRTEVMEGQPFCGASGAALNNYLFSGGLRRTDVAVLNVSPRRPSPSSDEIKLIPRPELEFWMEDLRRRLTLLPELRLVVPLGNTALEAVLGTDRVKLTKNKKLTIGKARGFYFDDIVLANGRKVLVIPNIHPAAALRETSYVKVIDEIWKKTGEELRTGLASDNNILGPLLDDTFEIEALPHPDDALEYAHKIITEKNPISFDIETPRDVPREKILCVGFSNDGKFGMTIPFDDHRAVATVPKEWRLKYIEAIRMIVESDVEKITQNGTFDCFMLARLKGINVRNMKYDTRTMHLCWDARRDHDLNSMGASFFRMRIWKDRMEDSRTADEYNELATYCARDALTTWHLAVHMMLKTFSGEDTLDVYERIYGKRFYPLLRIMLHGTAVDQKTREEIYNRLEGECASIRAELATIAGVPLSGGKSVEDAKSLSDQKIGQFLYGPKNPPERPIKLTPKKGLPAKNQPPPPPKGLELKPILDKDTKKPTSNEVALRTLRLRVEGKDERAAKAIDLILRHREQHQLGTFLTAERFDKDNRFRCSFGFAETGRLTSSANPVGTGGNSQNYARPVRTIFLPDDKCIFVQVDLSQVEDRILKVYSKDPDLMRLAKLKPWEYDAHSDLARKIFGLTADQKPTDEQRDMGKRTRHGSQRDLKGQRFADELLKSGVVRTKEWCDRMLEAYHAAEPGVRGSYFPYIRELVMRNEELVTPWGYKVSFKGERKDDDLFREAYSTLLQAGAVFTLDLQGLIPLDEAIERGDFVGTRINNEVHDAVYASCPLEEAYDVASFLVTNLEKPVEYDGVELSVPAECKISASLADDKSQAKSWKKFPSREEFMVDAERIFEIAEKRRHDLREWQDGSKSKRRSKMTSSVPKTSSDS